jgi:predicted dehydrogenase
MTSTPDPLRIALVGTGGMGTVHYHNYQHLPNCQVYGAGRRHHTESGMRRAVEPAALPRY